MACIRSNRLNDTHTHSFVHARSNNAVLFSAFWSESTATIVLGHKRVTDEQDRVRFAVDAPRLAEYAKRNPVVVVAEDRLLSPGTSPRGHRRVSSAASRASVGASTVDALFPRGHHPLDRARADDNEVKSRTRACKSCFASLHRIYSCHCSMRN